MKTEQEQIKAMTKDEIKKAFAICCGVQDCTGCPILDMEKQNGLGCKFNLFTRVIDTVSEQEKEIERLKAEFKQLETNAEILARGVRDLNHENYELTEKIKQVQERAVGLAAIETYHICNLIDELIKEVQNGKDKG